MDRSMEMMKTLGSISTTVRVESEQELAEFLEDINKIVRCSCSVRVGNRSSCPSVKGIETQINGVCEFSILYQAGKRSDEGGLSFYRVEVPFSHVADSSVEEEFDEDCLWCVTEIKPENVYCRPLGPRKLQLRCDLSVVGFVKGNVVFPFFNAEGEGMERKTEECPITVLKAVQAKELKLKEVVRLPKDFPSARLLGEADADLTVSSAKTFNGGVEIRINSELFASYFPEGGPAPLGFSQPIEIREKLEVFGAREGQECSAHSQLADLQLRLQEDSAGEQKEIVLEMSYLVCIAIYERSIVDVLTDCYCVEEQIRVAMESLETENVVLDFRSLASIQKESALKDPEVERIEMIRGEVSANNCVAKEKGIQVEGLLKLSMLGVKGENDAIALREELPFDALFAYQFQHEVF